MFGWRIVSWMEDAKGLAIVKIPWRDGWYFGVVLLEPNFKEFFAGWFKKARPDHDK